MGVSFGPKTKVEPGNMAHGNGNHARHAKEQCHVMLGFSVKGVHLEKQKTGAMSDNGTLTPEGNYQRKLGGCVGKERSLEGAGTGQSLGLATNVN